ncbi:MAG: hypothetical protein Q4D71_14605, partial [Oscillospiraceae bacterium]|nr:hypothetical protein [Oscillospiraceae bacterium]
MEIPQPPVAIPKNSTFLDRNISSSHFRVSVRQIGDIHYDTYPDSDKFQEKRFCALTEIHSEQNIVDLLRDIQLCFR